MYRGGQGGEGGSETVNGGSGIIKGGVRSGQGWRIMEVKVESGVFKGAGIRGCQDGSWMITGELGVVCGGVREGSGVIRVEQGQLRGVGGGWSWVVNRELVNGGLGGGVRVVNWVRDGQGGAKGGSWEVKGELGVVKGRVRVG